MKNFIESTVNLCNSILSKDEPLFSVVSKYRNITHGLFLEFGVYTGHTINTVASVLPKWTIYGFDSFEGLPETWRDGYNKGHFSLNGNLPAVRNNVKLVKGWFDETLPIWLEQNRSTTKIDILHIDCDIYSSTKTIFQNIGHLINTDTIIIFDELINYPTFEEHEIKALYEFMQEHGYDIDILCAGGHNSEKVAIKLVK